MPSDVLLVLNCQQDIAYGNREVLVALYGERFPDILFVVGPSCPIDPAFATIRSDWTPRLLGNRCACCPPMPDPHPSGRHATHPRLEAVALYAREQGFETIVFAEDDCILSPRLDPATIRLMLDEAGSDAIVPYVGFCDRDASSWVWTNHPTGYPAFDRVSDGLDRPRILRNLAAITGEPPPPVLYTPMIGGFVDILIFRTSLLLAMVPALDALQDVWHEIAIPTALVDLTPRVARIDGIPLWGTDRDRTTEDLFSMLDGVNYVHPIKLSRCSKEEALAGYRLAATR